MWEWQRRIKERYGESGYGRLLEALAGLLVLSSSIRELTEESLGVFVDMVWVLIALVAVVVLLDATIPHSINRLAQVVNDYLTVPIQMAVSVGLAVVFFGAAMQLLNNSTENSLLLLATIGLGLYTFWELLQLIRSHTTAKPTE